MSTIEFLKPSFTIPAGAGTTLGVFRLIVPEHAYYEQLSATSLFHARVKTVGTMGAIQITTNPVEGFGSANTGLEVGAGLDVNMQVTSIQNGSRTWLYPYIRFLRTGAAQDGTEQVRVVLSAGFEVISVVCIEAATGMPWSAGDVIYGS